MQSAFSQGWDAARGDYAVPPKAPVAVRTPKGLTDLQKEQYIAGYMAWCSDRYHGNKDLER